MPMFCMWNHSLKRQHKYAHYNCRGSNVLYAHRISSEWHIGSFNICARPRTYFTYRPTKTRWCLFAQTQTPASCSCHKLKRRAQCTIDAFLDEVTSNNNKLLVVEHAQHFELLFLDIWKTCVDVVIESEHIVSIYWTCTKCEIDDIADGRQQFEQD